MAVAVVVPGDLQLTVLYRHALLYSNVLYARILGLQPDFGNTSVTGASVVIGSNEGPQCSLAAFSVCSMPSPLDFNLYIPDL